MTGVSVARDAQAQIIVAHLPWVELATVVAIAVIVGLQFGSAGAPLATLACAGVAYLVAVRVVAWAGQLAGITVPPDLEPVLVVLLLGVTTDYAVFSWPACADGWSKGRADAGGPARHGRPARRGRRGRPGRCDGRRGQANRGRGCAGSAGS